MQSTAHRIAPGLLTILMFFALIGMLHAQWLQSTTLHAAMDSAAPVATSDRGTAAPTPTGEEITLFYFDEARPMLKWVCGALYNPYTVVVFGERMTLPTASGYVNSVAIRIDSAVGDSIYLDLWPDTLFQTQLGPFHLINYLSASAQTYVRVAIATSDIVLHDWTVVPLPHVHVPHEYFVTLTCKIVGNTIVSYFWLAGDSGIVQARTTENTRSGFVASYQGRALTAVLDSTFILTGSTAPAYSNFYIASFVDTSQPSGVRENPLREFSLATYPDPVQSISTMRVEPSLSWQDASLILYDPVGRSVADLTAQLRFSNGSSMTIDASHLATGVYVARLQTKSGLTQRLVRVVR